MAKKKRASTRAPQIAAPAPAGRSTPPPHPGRPAAPAGAAPTAVFDRVTGWLALPEGRLRWPWIALPVAVAWGFGFVVRLLWLPGAEANPQSVYAGHVTLTVTDGYFFAAGVQRAVDGLNEAIRRIPDWSDYALTCFGSLGAHLAPLPDVMVYLPAVIAPLIAVPLVLLGNLLGAPLWGFAAALLSTAGWSYYSRTLMGYFDTDMFSVTVPLALIVVLIGAVRDGAPRRTFIAGALMVVAPFFYDQVAPVLLAISGTFGAYLLLFHRRSDFTWSSIAVLAIALLPLPGWLRLMLLAGAWFALMRNRIPRRFFVGGALVLVLALVVTSPAVHMIFGEVTRYVDRGSVAGESPGDIAFLRVGGLVREMVRLPFPDLAERFAGSTAGVALAVVGYVLACLRYRPLLLLLPLVALGVFSLWGGLRFTIYVVPVAALGIAYLLARAATVLAALLARASHLRLRQSLGWLFTVAFLGPWLASQVDDARARPPVTVVQSGEADLMARFGALTTPGDYAVAWWDFGYPLYYFAHVGAIIDGGKHGHDNFVVSQILLTSSQRQAANLARVAVERFVTAESVYRPVIDALFEEAAAAGTTQRAWLKSLAEPAYTPPPKTRAVYLYLPHRMLTLLGAVEQFSRDARRAPGDAHPPFYVYTPASERNHTLYLSTGGFRIDLTAMKMVDRQGAPMSVQTFDLVEPAPDAPDAAGEPQAEAEEARPPSVRTQIADAHGRLHVIFLKQYGTVIVCDQELYDSTLIQLYVLGRYDHDLFAPVLRTPFGAIYRVLR